MTKTITISILLAAFLLIMFILTGIGVLNFTASEIFSLLMIIAGIGLAFIGLDEKASLIVFSGTVIFLVGTMILTKMNFEVEIEGSTYLPIIFLISAAGFIMIYINDPSKKFNILISLILLSSAAALILTRKSFEPGEFSKAILPLLNLYWPAVIILVLMIILFRKVK